MTAPPPTPAEVMAVLHAIERGEITVRALDDPKQVFAGDVRYEASNGWALVVFNDCDSWDYLDSVDVPGGDTLGFWGRGEDGMNPFATTGRRTRSRAGCTG